jgi:hypothetical protein
LANPYSKEQGIFGTQQGNNRELFLINRGHLERHSGGFRLVSFGFGLTELSESTILSV